MITLTRRLVERYHTPLTVVGGAVLGVAIVLLYLELKPPQGRFTDADARRVAQERIDAITPAPPREPEIFATVRPSIVTIRKEGAGLTRGIGAGVVFDANGGILTAYHVVVGVEEVTVRFFDGTTVTGRVGETQPERDLAIVTKWAACRRACSRPFSAAASGRVPGCWRSGRPSGWAAA